MNSNFPLTARLCAVAFTLSLTAGIDVAMAAGSATTKKVQASVEPTEEIVAYKYIGNNFSLKFHKPSCPFAKAMWTGHTELFHFRKDAVAAKYTPCRYCLPPSWTTVNATILAPKAQNPQSDAVSAPESSHLHQSTQPKVH